MTSDDREGTFPVRVAIATDALFYNEGLRNLLNARNDVDVVAIATDAPGALAVVMRNAPDVVLVDVPMPGGSTLVRSIAETWPATKTVALALADEPSEAMRWAETGVAGYVTRNSSVDDLVEVVKAVVRGESLCSPRVAALLMERVAGLTGRSSLPDAASLTSREVEIVRLLDEGLSNRQIAGRLYIESSTVKNHVHNILDKLHVKRRSEAVAAARRDGLLSERDLHLS